METTSGWQLNFVALKIHKPADHVQPLRLKDLVPHVTGSLPMFGSWDPSGAVSTQRESTNTWELSFVVPADLEKLEFKFILKAKPGNRANLIATEEGTNRVLHAGSMAAGEAGPDAQFKLLPLEEEEYTPPLLLTLLVSVEVDPVSPFALAASWQVVKKNIQSHGSTVLGIPDVCMGKLQHRRCASEAQISSSSPRYALELDLQHYEVPTPTSNMSAVGIKYSANGAEDPSKSLLDQTSSGADMANFRDRSVSIKTMPEAAGAVAAAAVADRLLGPREHRQLAIILVGLPARGKTFTAAKLTRYLRWLGHDTKHFNIGKYRRLKHGCSQTADFFRGDNQEGMEARNEVAVLAMEDMLAWMQEGGQVGVFDATNSTNTRRNLLMKLAKGKCKVIFLETICNDKMVIDTNIRLKIQQSPDYADVSDYKTALADFTARLENYEKVYEPVTEGSYIKMIDMVSGEGGHMQVNNISGYLPGRIVFFLVNTHITPRPILLTRHGESCDNVRGRIGGDPVLSEAGERYALKLADFVNKRLKSERTASIWTSTLHRTVLTAANIVEFPKVQWRTLDEINAGVCDGMTYEEIRESMPEEYRARKVDKLRYRYPRGESYLDVIQRLEPVIVELERQRSPVVVIAHQAVLRALYAYFMGKPLKEVPHIEVPLHTIIEIQMGVTGVQEKRYKLMEISH
ncbi:unnamed protein product [Sphagnum compactum]